jgi:hypothetical protein
MTMPERTGVQTLADEIMELVRSTSVGGHRGDAAGLVMFAAYLHGFRRLAAIRLLAAAARGPEALILARSLLSLVARAAYVDAPVDASERERRFLQYRVHDLNEEARTFDALARAGFDVSDDRAGREAELADIGDVGGFPDDASLLRQHVGLEAFHARLYRPSSEHVHFSQRVALDAVAGIEQASLDDGDAELAEEALSLAIVTFGTLLELSERSVRHGLAQRVGDLARAVFTPERREG